MCHIFESVKTSPSVADAAVTRITQQTKIIAEGGYEKVFKQTFECLPEEQLKKWFACYLSTSAGPVMGTLYLSTAKLAFCSDNPLSYTTNDKTEWSYYKVCALQYYLSALPCPPVPHPFHKILLDERLRLYIDRISLIFPKVCVAPCYALPV